MRLSFPSVLRKKCIVKCWAIAFVLISALLIFPQELEAQCSPGGNVGFTLTPCNISVVLEKGKTHEVNIKVRNNNKFESQWVSLPCTVTGQMEHCSFSPSGESIPPLGEKVFRLTARAGLIPGTGKVIITDYQDTIFYTILEIRDFSIDSFRNKTHGMLELCAVSCFAGTASFSTVPFYTLDVPRSVQLIYTEERANPRPSLYADISLTTNSLMPEYYTFEAEVNGVAVQFINGDTKLYFSNGGGKHIRLGGQFDARGYSTGVHPLTVRVTGHFSGGFTTQKTYSESLIIVNEAESYVAKGWTIAGIQRLYFLGSGGYLITDGFGSAVHFPSANAIGEDYSKVQMNPGTSEYTRIYSDHSKVVFNSNGYAIKQIDPSGAITSITYDGSGRVQTVQDPLRTSLGSGTPYISFAYDTYGLASISEVGGSSVGRTTAVRVGTDSMLLAIKDPDGDSTRYTYDENRRIKTVINRLGAKTTYTYNNYSWKLTQIDLPIVAINSGSGSTTNASPKIQYSDWQSLGIPTSPTSSSSLAVPIKVSDFYGQITDQVGRTTRLAVDSWGQPRWLGDSSGITQFIRFGYLPIQILYPDGRVSKMTYLNGTPLLTSHESGLSEDGEKIYLAYDNKNRVDSVWGPRQASQRLFLDSISGRVDSIRFGSSDSNVTRYNYDGMNRVIQKRDERMNISIYKYDSIFGNLDTIVSQIGSKVIRVFDQHGRDSLLWSSGQDYWSIILYDLMNREVKTWSLGAFDDTTLTTYNALLPTRIRTAGGQVHKFEYNDLGWSTKRYDVKDTMLYLSFRYDIAGRMTGTTNRRGQHVDITLDPSGRILTRSGNGVPTDSFTYSSDYKTVQASRLGSSRDTLMLDNMKRPLRNVMRIDGMRYEIQYGNYIGSDTRSQAMTVSSSFGTSFANTTHLRKYEAYVSDSIYITGGGGAGVTSYTRNSSGLTTATKWPTAGISDIRNYSYTPDGIPFAVTYTAGGDSLNRFATYDSLGRTVADIRSNSSGTIIKYNIYDQKSRLLKVWNTVHSAPCTVSENDFGAKYTCQPGSAITSDSSSYDNAGNRIVAGAAYTASGNRILAWPGASYTYDADGNMLTRTRTGVTDSLFWNAINQLDSVRSAGLRISYTYDAFGRLIRRAKNGIIDRYFLWDDTHLLAELSGSGSRISQYIYRGTDNPVAIATDSAGTSLIRYFAHDLQGNVIGIRRGTSLKQFSRYSAWGKLESRSLNTMADTNRLGWKGLLYEGDSTKLYYVRNRWYDPEIGRFISEDPVGIAGGINLYTYGGNDPLNRWDPYGLADLPAVRIYADRPLRYDPSFVGWGMERSDDPEIREYVVKKWRGAAKLMPYDDVQALGSSIKDKATTVFYFPTGDCAHALTGAAISVVSDIAFFSGVGAAGRFALAGMRYSKMAGRYASIMPKLNAMRGASDVNMRVASDISIALSIKALTPEEITATFIAGDVSIWDVVPGVGSVRAAINAASVCRGK